LYSVNDNVDKIEIYSDFKLNILYYNIQRRLFIILVRFSVPITSSFMTEGGLEL